MPDDPRAARLLRDFRAWTGHGPEGVWRAPGRVNLIGEHLDYNGGHVLPFAIDRSAVVAVRRTGGAAVRVASRQYPDGATAPDDGVRPDWSAYPVGVLQWMDRAGAGLGGAEILIDSNVPQGAGLSSSAALACALTLACVDLAGGDSTSVSGRRWMVAAAQAAESHATGVAVGNMDQAASFLGRAGHALFLDTGTLDFELLPLNAESAGCRILGVWTGAPHRVASGAYGERRAACEAVAAALGADRLAQVPIEALDRTLASLVGARAVRLARHVITEEGRTTAAAAVLRAGRLADLGPLVTGSHRSLQHDFASSTPAVDAVVDAALSAGALGARMTGAGWGGTVLVLAPAAAAAGVASATRQAVAAGGTEAEVLDLVPAAGASRAA